MLYENRAANLRHLKDKEIQFPRHTEVTTILYEDKEGILMRPEEVEALSPHEIEERGIHVFDDPRYAVV